MRTETQRTARINEPTMFQEPQEKAYLEQIVRTLRSNFLNLETRAFGPAIYKSTAIDTDYDVTLFDEILIVDATAGNIAITLPNVSDATGQSFTVKKVDASGNTVTLSAGDGGTPTLSTQYDFVEVYSDGTDWWVVA